MIRVRFLEAIEAEEFGALPGGVYATSYIRQYCRAIGQDEAAILARYRAQAESAPVAPASRRLPKLNWRPRGRRQHTA
jgi:cytoskeletal protein RodZ